MASRERKRWKQLELPRRGGKREGAGRKRTGARPLVAHRVRPEVKAKTPVHVTLRVLPEIARLRRREQYRAIRRALARTGHGDRCRIVHYSIQGNHLHLMCEPDGKRGLASGMTAFKTSCARRLNGIVARRGPVFADRYHARYLQTPAQVRNALSYILNNWRRHGEHRANASWRVDPFSSAELFDGWEGADLRRSWWVEIGEPRPVPEPRFWLLTTGWKRHGRLRPTEIPGGTRAR
jgi:REP element-mobilizing transposase RayT